MWKTKKNINFRVLNNVDFKKTFRFSERFFNLLMKSFVGQNIILYVIEERRGKYRPEFQTLLGVFLF